jgi:ribonuclease G
MSKELVISSNAHETKVAILEDDQLVEIYFQRAHEYSLAGSIHKGRVTRVLPGMQSAFVDLGLERDTFLYVSDFFEENGEEYDRIPEDRQSQRGSRPERERQTRPERSDRTERSEGSERSAAPAGLVQATPTVPAPEPVETVTADEVIAPPEPVAERVADDDGRDRRGRRSRRRRSRGRGFPESKYASDLGSSERERDPEPAEALIETEEPSEVFLLPGESLAKYSQRSSRTEREAMEENGTSELSQEDSEEEPEETAEADARDAEPEEEAVGMRVEEPAPLAEETVVFAEPVEAPESSAGVALAPATEEAEPEPVEIPTETSEAPESAAAVEPPADDFTTTELEELVSEEFDDAVDETAEDVGDALAEAIATEPSEGAEGGIEASLEDVADGPAAASVRDQSGRYQHRQSRRMRRRRGGDRHEQQAASVPPPVIETEIAGKSDKPPAPSISDLLREGQEIIVQIAKEPLGQKGARITSHIALPGRFVVFMPTLEHLGVSRKIASDEERQRLKRILQIGRAGISGGFIVRTAGEGRSEEEIAGDMAYLYNLWLDIRQKSEKRKAPALLHHDLDIVHRILRDQLSDMFKAIWIDSEDVYESVLRFMQRFQPALVGRVKMYTRPAPIFDAFGITQEIEKALRPKVWLKSGGYIVINQTEALVAIDVNTGKYVGKSNRLEDTITKTNTEAVREIVRQIRLRDLGGIIVVDFIDMDERKNRQKVMQTLEEAMRADRAPYKILQFNDFGLVAITRKRVKQSLERTLCSPCPVCEGAGYTKSVPTVVGEILQEAAKVRKVVEGKTVTLRVYPEVAKYLKSNTNTQLEEIEGILDRPVMVMSDSMLHPEKFDLAW